MELSCDVRLGIIFNVEEKSIVWDNLEEKVLKIGLNIHLRVGTLTGSITCGTEWVKCLCRCFYSG